MNASATGYIDGKCQYANCDGKVMADDATAIMYN